MVKSPASAYSWCSGSTSHVKICVAQYGIAYKFRSARLSSFAIVCAAVPRAVRAAGARVTCRRSALASHEVRRAVRYAAGTWRSRTSTTSAGTSATTKSATPHPKPTSALTKCVTDGADRFCASRVAAHSAEAPSKWGVLEARLDSLRRSAPRAAHPDNQRDANDDRRQRYAKPTPHFEAHGTSAQDSAKHRSRTRHRTHGHVRTRQAAWKRRERVLLTWQALACRRLRIIVAASWAGTVAYAGTEAPRRA